MMTKREVPKADRAGGFFKEHLFFGKKVEDYYGESFQFPPRTGEVVKPKGVGGYFSIRIGFCHTIFKITLGKVEIKRIM